MEDILGGQAMWAYLGSGPRKREHNVSCFFIKRYVSLVCNEFVT